MTLRKFIFGTLILGALAAAAQTIDYRPALYTVAVSSDGGNTYAPLTSASGVGTVTYAPPYFVPMCSSDGGHTYSQCSFSGGGGSVSLTSPSSTLTLSPSPITGTGTLDLNLAHANTWTAMQTFPAVVVAGSGAGVVTLTQGTAPSTVASSVNLIAPATVTTAYNYIFPAAPFNNTNPVLEQCTGTASSTSCAPASGSASTALVTGTYSDISFNNVHTAAGHIGIQGDSSGTDPNVYVDTVSGGNVALRSGGTAYVMTGSASSVYGGFSLDQTLVPANMIGFFGDSRGVDPNLYANVPSGGNFTYKVANGNIVFLIQPTGSAPTGSCSANEFEITVADGHGTWCNGTTWVSKF